MHNQSIVVLNELGKQNYVSIAWISGHAEVHGNEVADYLAKSESESKMHCPEPLFQYRMPVVLARLRIDPQINGNQRWSRRGHILKSLALASKVKSLALALKPQVLENCPILGSRTALFFEWLKFNGKRLETSRNICEHLFRFPQLEHWRSQGARLLD